MSDPPTPSQADIDRQVTDHRRVVARATGGLDTPTVHPSRDFPPYRSSRLRHPHHPLVMMHDPDAAELTGPVFGATDVTMRDADLTAQHHGEPAGQRITVAGRVRDRDGRPVRGQLVEVWQTNAAGRYAHQGDQHPAPLDPHFTGVGRCLTDDHGGYRFTTVRPGAYPWRNHVNAWRPAHIHFSLFGNSFAQRLVTQMYFPDDPLLPHDPVLASIADDRARGRLVATYDHGLSIPERSLGYRWDVVLDGPCATWVEEVGR